MPIIDCFPGSGGSGPAIAIGDALPVDVID